MGIGLKQATEEHSEWRCPEWALRVSKSTLCLSRQLEHSVLKITFRSKVGITPRKPPCRKDLEVGRNRSSASGKAHQVEIPASQFLQGRVQNIYQLAGVGSSQSEGLSSVYSQGYTDAYRSNFRPAYMFYSHFFFMYSILRKF